MTLAIKFPKRYYEGDVDATNGGSGTSEVLEVINALGGAGIPACIVGTHALRYFGAGRVADEWDMCVPDEKFQAAQHLLENAPHDREYEPAEPTLPCISSVRHQFPTYKQRGVHFFFILNPSSACFIDPRPEFCERSQMGIPYPQDVFYTRSLIALQCGADLADMVDAQDLTLEWGQKHLNFPELTKEAAEFAKGINERLRKDEDFAGGLDENDSRPYEKTWIRVVEGKNGRIEPMKQGRYITRWRAKAFPGDPRKPDPRRPPRIHV